MSSEPVIEVEGLSKAFLISAGELGHRTFREALAGRARNPLARRSRELFWALEDINLVASPGEVVGLIGGNGAGKSTLLKILCRITEPTRGRAVLRGRVGSLLEVGTGFHPELTGRENIFLNGAILGMPRVEIQRRFPEIVEFAGIGVFLDTPVKRYSSGMYVRLAFAVAAHLQPEILLVDEVLAVGDAEFQRRCLGRMEDAAREEGRTILFVSHNLAAVESLCTRAIYLRDGRVAMDGSVRDAIDQYMRVGEVGTAIGSADLSGRVNPFQPDHRPVIEGIATLGAESEIVSTSIPIGADLRVRLRARGLNRLESPVLGVRIRNGSHVTVAEANTRMAPLRVHQGRTEVEDITLTLESVALVPGDYWLDVGIKAGMDETVVDLVERVLQFSVVATDYFGSGFQPTSTQGFVLLRHRWDVVPAGERHES